MGPTQRNLVSHPLATLSLDNQQLICSPIEVSKFEKLLQIYGLNSFGSPQTIKGQEALNNPIKLIYFVKS